MRRTTFAIGIVTVLLLIVGAGWAAARSSASVGVADIPPPAGTAFTYQGLLKDAGGAVDQTCDFRFGLYDTSSSGSLIGAVVDSTGVSVSDGLFTVGLDFGASAFDGSRRYLEIEARCPAGGGGYTMLSPRQELAPAPHAMALPGLYTRPNVTSSNVIGGFGGNSIATGIVGATISGGGKTTSVNRITDDYGTVGGGVGNQAGDGNTDTTDAKYATVAGGYDNVASSTYSFVGGGAGNHAVGIYATVSGGGGGGSGNQVTDNWGTVGGGSNNIAGNGTTQTFDATYATVGGGYSNEARADYATVAGGFDSGAFADYATVGGGFRNNASSSYSTVAGGWDNTASGLYSLVGGGVGNVARATYATIGGGGGGSTGNKVTDDYGTIGGGSGNEAGDNAGSTSDATYATVGGGESNKATAQYATIGGGSNNQATCNLSAIGGGIANKSSGLQSAIGGGNTNSAKSTHATVGGGQLNTASSTHSTVGGGKSNVASGQHSVIGGGNANEASAKNSTVPGGSGAKASHYGEMAYASGNFSAVGDAQASLYVLRGTTTDAVATEIFLDGVAERITVASGRAVAFDILLAGRNSAGSSAIYKILGLIENTGGTTRILATNIPWSSSELGGTNPTIQADDTADALVIKVTGQAANTIRWVATVLTTGVAW